MMVVHSAMTEYEVFARQGSEPLYHVGSVRATNADDAGVFAYTIYDERGWDEMLVVPRDRIVPIIKPQ